MSNDLSLIKKKILDEDKVEKLLEYAGCERVRKRGNRYESMLPDKFNSDNDRSVQVYLNESLVCKIRTRSFLGTDIFDLISYIVFDCYESDEMSKCLPKSKRWICDKLGYNEFLEGGFVEQKEDDPLKWLKDLKKKRNRKKYESQENKSYDESILNQYIMYPYEGYLKEGIDYGTQVEFQIGFDLLSERIIFPIRNQYGDIVSVKGRTIDAEYKSKGIPKFLYLYNFNMMYELYNWDKALYYIYEKKEIIIYEAEKTCWLSSQFGFRNCVALGGSEISDYQVNMIKTLDLDFKIVLAFDRDKTPDEIMKQAQKFGKVRQLYVMWDKRSVFSKELKHSPTDLGKDAFEQLYRDMQPINLAARTGK